MYKPNHNNLEKTFNKQGRLYTQKMEKTNKQTKKQKTENKRKERYKYNIPGPNRPIIVCTIQKPIKLIYPAYRFVSVATKIVSTL